MLTPEEEQSREVFAHFGRAYYFSECVHRGLVNVFAYRLGFSHPMTRPMFEERMAVATKKTLGELVGDTESMLPSAVRDSLAWAVATRNFLAHGFWYDRAHLLGSETSKLGLIDELTRAAEVMEGISAMLDRLVLEHLRHLGVTDDHLAAEMAAVRAEAPEPPMQRVVPRTGTYIDIVEAWTTGEGALVLRGADGLLWQLCDSGLGWSMLQQEPDWKPMAALSGLLPAGIVARPKGGKPWSYRLHVSTGGFIEADPDPVVGYRWRVRKGPPRG